MEIFEKKFWVAQWTDMKWWKFSIKNKPTILYSCSWETSCAADLTSNISIVQTEIHLLIFWWYSSIPFLLSDDHSQAPVKCAGNPTAFPTGQVSTLKMHHHNLEPFCWLLLAVKLRRSKKDWTILSPIDMVQPKITEAHGWSSEDQHILPYPLWYIFSVTILSNMNTYNYTMSCYR